MELWIWVAAIGLGLLIMVFSIVWLGSRGVKVARKLKPFAEHWARFQKQAELYPEAVKFYSDLAKSPETPPKKSRGAKD